MRNVHRLVIVSHVPHFLRDGVIYAYGPYAREIDIWCDLFPEVEIAAPCRYENPPGDALPLTRTNIRMRPQIEAGGDRWQDKVRQFMLLPLMAARLAGALRSADAIHVRCPGNLGLLGVLIAPLFSKRRIAKYAGQWNGYRQEPLAVRWQRRLLQSRWWGAPVTVYGEWPEQPAHIIPFFTSMMSRAQMTHAEEIARARRVDTPLRVVFVGALAVRKRVDALIEAAALLIARGVALELTIVGDGPERAALEALAQRCGVAARVTFTGAVPFDEGLRWYEWANCLVLPSAHSEGWPKAVAEAMSFGVIAIAVDHGQLSSMLRGRGRLLPAGSAAEIADALFDVTREPERHLALARQGAQWAASFSLEGLREALGELLHSQWGFVPRTAAAVVPSRGARV
jgi:glycosyltransferase involved in cell wall biosynthesis